MRLSVAVPLLFSVVIGARPTAGSIPPSSAAGAGDTAFVWTVEPYRYDPSFAARNFGCAVFDTRRGRALVLTGGQNVTHPGANFYSQGFGVVARGTADTDWSAIAGSGPLVDEACAAYDSLDDVVWLFGGLHYTNTGSYGWTTSVMGELWRFDVASGVWTRITPLGSAPSPRRGASLVIDPVRGRLWLFGGTDGLGVFMNDLWSMDVAAPGNWSLVSPLGPVPTARARHLAVFDPGADVMLVTGGEHGAGARSDAWSLSLGGTSGWLPLATTGTPPSGRLVGALDAVRGRLLAGGNGDGAIYALDRASGEWSAHLAVGEGIIAGGSAVILDPAQDVLISAWSGVAVVAGGAPFTPPTAFLHLAPLQPTVHLSASLTEARFLHGITELIWDMQFDHPLWTAAVLESTSTVSGVTAAVRTVVPQAPGPTSVGIYDPSIAGDSLQLRFRWFDGGAWQQTSSTGLRFPPAPMFLHVSPDTLWIAGSDLTVWFDVPDDSAQYLVDQTLERRDDGGPWSSRWRGFPDGDRKWKYVEAGVVPFTTYDFRLTWTGPDGVTRASAPFGTTVLAPPVLTDVTAYPDSVILSWITRAGIDERGRVLVNRPGSPGPWSDTIAVRTDAAGSMVVRDRLTRPDTDIDYRMEWYDGRQWWATPDLDVHTPGGGAPPPAPVFTLGRAQPDPASDGFDLPIAIGGSGSASIELYDLAGRRRWSGSATAGTPFLHVDASALETGVYLVRGVASGLVRTRRVAIVR